MSNLIRRNKARPNTFVLAGVVVAILNIVVVTNASAEGEQKTCPKITGADLVKLRNDKKIVLNSKTWTDPQKSTDKLVLSSVAKLGSALGVGSVATFVSEKVIEDKETHIMIIQCEYTYKRLIAGGDAQRFTIQWNKPFSTSSSVRPADAKK